MKCSCGGTTLPKIVLALSLWPCASLFAQDYEIHLFRPQTVGQKYHLSATGRSAHTVVERAGDKILRNDATKFSVECECVVTVLKVDDKGKPSKLSLEIEKLTRTDDANPRELVSKDSVITVSMKDGAEVSELEGHRLSLPTQEAIMVVVPLDPGGPTNDELYGTSERKKPGDEWDANTEAMVKDMFRRKATVKKQDIRGTVTFDKVGKVGKTECLEISGSMDCSRYVPDVPRGVSVEKGFLKIGFSEKLPVAPAMPMLELTQSANIGYTMRGRLEPTAADEVIIDVGGVLNSFSRMTEAPAAEEVAPK